MICDMAKYICDMACMYICTFWSPVLLLALEHHIFFGEMRGLERKQVLVSDWMPLQGERLEGKELLFTASNRLINHTPVLGRPLADRSRFRRHL